MMDKDEFYVGYHQRAPAGLGRWLSRWVIALLVLVVLMAGLLVSRQLAFAPATFEFLNYRSFHGLVLQDPYPRLLIEHPGQHEGHSTFSSYTLVAPFKFGADELVADFVGKQVTLQGALIYRDRQTMLELLPGSISEVVEPVAFMDGQGESLGKVSMVGEIVDSKCFTGVMKPGNLKPHKGCAIRCLSGGIPPALIVRAQAEPAQVLMLVGAQGEPVGKQVLDLVAVPVRVEGELLRHGDTLILKADPATYERL